MPRILITGATGFVGTALSKYLSENTAFILRLAARSSISSEAHEYSYVGDLNEHTDWKAALNEVDVVIHLAARVHMMKENDTNSCEAYKTTNTLATINLAEQAVNAGVKRFIFLSSIKVNGESTLNGIAFTADDTPNPIDPYGVSKWSAEIALQEISNKTEMEVVIVRPPLIYGSGVKANFYSMVKLIRKLPVVLFPVIENRRSLVSLDNLNHLIKICIDHPNAKNQVFLVSDDKDLSTTQIIEKIAKSLRKKFIPLKVPLFFLKLFFLILNRKNQFNRLFGSLQVDISKNKKLLDWQPTHSMERTLEEIVKNES